MFQGKIVRHARHRGRFVESRSGAGRQQSIAHTSPPMLSHVAHNRRAGEHSAAYMTIGDARSVPVGWVGGVSAVQSGDRAQLLL